MSLASATIEAKELSFAPLAAEEKSCLRQNYRCDVKNTVIANNLFSRLCSKVAL